MMHKRQFSENGLQMKKTSNPCTSCGCTCRGRLVTDRGCNLDLHQRIEELQSQVLRGQARISNMELDCENRVRASSMDLLKLREELVKLRDKYERLLESHKKMQKVNDGLENKLLKVVNSTEGDKTKLQKELATITSRLVEAKSIVVELEDENERYRTDCNLAVQLLHCKPSNFVGHKLDTLPPNLQERLRSSMSSEQIIDLEDNGQPEMTKLIHVPMQTFPPTAMVYSVPKQEKELQKCENIDQNVPMTLIAKVLTHPESKRRLVRTYMCVRCKADYTVMSVATQTMVVRDVEKRKNSRSGLEVHRKLRNNSTSSTETDI